MNDLRRSPGQRSCQRKTDGSAQDFPLTPFSATRSVRDIVKGPYGNLWFTEPQGLKIVRFGL